MKIEGPRLIGSSWKISGSRSGSRASGLPKSVIRVGALLIGAVDEILDCRVLLDLLDLERADRLNRAGDLARTGRPSSCGSLPVSTRPRTSLGRSILVGRTSGMIIEAGDMLRPPESELSVPISESNPPSAPAE